MNGTERMGWEQPAPSFAELQTYGYLAYVDDVPVGLPGVTCESSPGVNGFLCSARLPPMTPGLHMIALSAYVDRGSRWEGPKSAPLQVRLVTMATSVVPTTADAGTGTLVRRLTTLDGVLLQAHVVASGLVDPTDLVVVPDGRVLVAERAGRVRVFRDGQLADRPALVLSDVEGPDAGELLALAIDPEFQETAAVYAVYTTPAGFRLARFHAVGDVLRDRAILLDGVEAGDARPGAALRVGPDRKLYAAFDDGGDPHKAGDLGAFSGKVLRLNLDGTTPADQPGSTPVLAADINRPTSLDWSLDGATLWVGERDADGADRLNVMVAGAPGAPGVIGPEARPAMARRYTLPQGTGARGAVFYWGPAIPAFQGDLFVAADTARALLRVRFESPGSNTIVATEWILRDELGPIRGVAVAPDGGLYFCTADALLLITPER